MGLTSTDQEKAFDQVEHNYLWKTLKAFGFGSDFIDNKSFIFLYCDIESVLKFNGSLCAPFKVCRRVRQGCCLSVILYALAIDPLFNILRTKLKGFSIPDVKTPSVCQLMLMIL